MHKRVMVLMFVLLFCVCFFYFKWFAFSYTITRGNEIYVHLPAFINENILRKNGFELEYEHSYFHWKKKGFFKLNFNSMSFSDTLDVELISSPSLYPFCYFITIKNISLESNDKLLKIIKKQPDSVKVIDIKESISDSDSLLSVTKTYYNFGSGQMMQHRISNYKLEENRIYIDFYYKNYEPSLSTKQSLTRITYLPTRIINNIMDIWGIR